MDAPWRCLLEIAEMSQAAPPVLLNVLILGRSRNLDVANLYLLFEEKSFTTPEKEVD
jgi:hypothetical protein